MAVIGVVHNAALERFEEDTAPEGKPPQLAVAEYKICDARGPDAERSVLDLRHTEVPVHLRGRGIADRLCQAVFEYAHEAGLCVRPSCSYVSDTWLPRHPEFLPVAEDAAITPAFHVCEPPEAASQKESESEDEEWGTAAQRSIQAHTFGLARAQYETQLAAATEPADKARPLVRLGSLLTTRARELISGADAGSDGDKGLVVRSHVVRLTVA